MALMDRRLWDPSRIYMSMNVNMLASGSVVTIEQMKNLIMKTIMMLIVTIARRMGAKEATTWIATIVEKVVLVVLWSMTTLMLPPLTMVMADLVMLARNSCITERIQPTKVPTKKLNFKTIYNRLMGTSTLRPW
jgi:hypothetical protein